MDPYNQTIGESFSSNDTYTEEVPLFATYLIMVVILIMTLAVIYLAVIVTNVIWKTRELHTKYYFLVANLLTTDITGTPARSATQYFIVILYLLDLQSDSAITILRFLVIPIRVLFHLMTVLLPISLAIERMIVIGFPYRHRSIMTTKTAISILAMMWSLSFILTTLITVTVPVNVMWPLALIRFDGIIAPFFALPRLTAAT